MTKHENIVLEQYKILFAILIGLADNLVKSVLTIFVIYASVLAIVINGIDAHPNLKYLLYVNYAIILSFFYYLAYLRFRTKTQLELVESLEKQEKFKHSLVKSYDIKTRGKFLSTKGLLLVMAFVLLGVNTLFIIFL